MSADPLQSSPPGFAHRRNLFVILLVALVIRIGFVLLAQDMKLLGDMDQYIRVAEALAKGRGYIHMGRGWWPPLFPAFWALCWKIFGPDQFYPRLFQAIFSTATVFFCYRIAWVMFGSARLAWIAAAALAVYAPLASMSSYLWSETLFIFFFTAAVAAWFEGIRTDRRGWYVLAGIAFGLGALTKGIGLYLAIPWIGWQLWFVRGADWRRTVRHLAAFLAAVVLCIAPWTIRNYILYDRFILIDTTLGRTLWDGQNFQPAYP